MEIDKSLSLTILFFVALILMFQHSCLGQNTPQDYVDAHNKARAAVGVDKYMIWNDIVAAYAENYAKERSMDCSLVHSQNPPYGENIADASGYGTAVSFTGVDAVNLWVNESSNYDYSSNQCIQGTMCGHYTQVVWRNSVNLGCARVECSNGGVFVTCNYDPPGNIEGQRPY